MVCKIAPFLKLEIILVFVNTFTADYQYPFLDYDNLSYPFQMKLSQKQKTFSEFFFHFWNLHQILNIFLKKKIVTANSFLKLQTVKDLVRPLSKKRSFRTSFQSQHFKGSQTLVKSAWQHFYHIFPSLWGEMIWKMSPLSKFEILGAFVNRWTSNDKYDVPDCENLGFPIQMQLS